MIDEQIIEAFGKVLRKYRMSKGQSQEALAHAINSHPTHISRLENGHKQPTLTTLYKISKQLGIKPEEMIVELNRLIKN